MLTYSIKEIAEITGGIILRGNHETTVSEISIDSRNIKKGEEAGTGTLFIALKGNQVDGHKYVLKAFEAGALAAMVSEAAEITPFNGAIILVPNTLHALQQLAAHNRSLFNIPVVAVTGSNGKTSTKDMIASILSTCFNTLKTQGNYNNELGLPLTLLQLKSHQAAVVEMGMRGLGEIDFLAEMAKPTCAVITNIGEAHLERLGSVKNIAQAKGEVLDHIGKEGFAILHADSPYMEEQAIRCKGSVWKFSVGGEADISASNLRPESGGVRYNVSYPGGQGEVYLPVPGSHNVANSLAAIGVGLKLGLSFENIVQGLEELVLTHMRLEVIQVQGLTIINDTYNASPASTKAAIRVLEETPATRRIAVLGNMFELGDFSEDGHSAVGEVAARAGVAHLVTVGDLAKYIALGGAQGGLPGERIHQCDENIEAIKLLKDLLKKGDAVLVKGSRGMKMELIVSALLEN